MNLPPELVELVFYHVTDMTILSYYIRKCRPSNKFVSSIVGRPDYFLAEYGMRMEVYQYLFNQGFRIYYSDIELFMSHATTLLIKTVAPYHKSIVSGLAYSASKYFAMAYPRIGLDGCKIILSDLKEEYLNMRHDASYVRYIIRNVLNTVTDSDLDWFIENVIVGDEHYPLNGETGLIAKIKLLTYKDFVLHHPDKLHAIMELDIDMAHTLHRDYKNLRSDDSVWVECTMTKEEHFIMVQDIKEYYPTWNIVCLNAMRWGYTRHNKFIAPYLRSYFEGVEEISAHINYYTDSVLNEMRFIDILYVLDSALYLDFKKGVSMMYKLSHILKSNGVYMSYDNLVLYLMTGNMQYYHRVDLEKLSRRRIIELIYKYLGVIHGSGLSELYVHADGNCTKDIAETLDEYAYILQSMPMILDGLNGYVYVRTGTKSIMAS